MRGAMVMIALFVIPIAIGVLVAKHKWDTCRAEGLGKAYCTYFMLQK